MKNIIDFFKSINLNKMNLKNSQYEFEKNVCFDGHVNGGQFYLCNDMITNNVKKSIALNLKVKHEPYISHYHCINCKIVRELKYRTTATVLKNKGTIYAPNMSCNELSNWTPDEK